MRDNITGTQKIKVYDILKRNRPFENDPDLRRTLNRLSSTNSRLGSWVGNTSPESPSAFRRKMLNLVGAK